MKERLGERLPRSELHSASISLVVLDWSGVISDDRWSVYEANMRVLATHGKSTISFEEWLPRTTMTPVEFFREHGVQGDADKLYDLYKRNLDEVVESGIFPTVYPGASEVLSTLRKRGKRAAVLSSHPIENLLREAKDYSLDQFLDHVFGSCRDKVEGLKKVCSRLEELPATTLYIGDTIYDIRSAKEAGCQSAGICSGYHSQEKLSSEKPEALFKDLSDFKSWLERGE